MKWHPPGYGGTRRPPEEIKREGWREQSVLVIDANDARLSWPDRQLIRELGDKLYGGSRRKDSSHG